MSTTESSRYEAHQEAWESLPWYVNGTLARGELERVERHVADCVTCRSEIRYLRQLAGWMQATEPPLPAEGPGLSALLERIDHLERDGARGPASGLAAGLRRQTGSWLRHPRRLRQLLAAQAAAILALVGLAVWQGSNAPPPTYRTLAEAAAQGAEEAPRLRLVFADGVSERQVRDLVRFVDGEIVGGPSPMGVYTVRLGAASADEATLTSLLAELRASPQVQFAEIAAPRASDPIEPTTSRR